MTLIHLSEGMTSQRHQGFLIGEANAQFDFFDQSIRPEGGFHVLDLNGAAVQGEAQELHASTRMVHSYALGKLANRRGCEAMIDHGMAFLWAHHRDADHGGYVWSLNGNAVQDGVKLAYGHVFVLLAASSAMAAGHPDAQRLLDDVDQVLDTHFWDTEHGLFCDEWNRDWTPFSTYRGMNANMHGVEALLAAYEATGRDKYLIRAQSILEFFLGGIAPAEGWRLPEHYTETWQVDRSYAGNPMFRPAGTTPGHSFELARLLLQFNELCGAPDPARVQTARRLTYQAITDAWDAQRGGIFYTLNFDGSPAITDRYWWPITEAIGVMAALLKADPRPEDAEWYARLWTFAQENFMDDAYGGWFPEIDAQGGVTSTQFIGKPDIYHSIQAALFPLTPRISGMYQDLKSINLGGEVASL